MSAAEKVRGRKRLAIKTPMDEDDTRVKITAYVTRRTDERLEVYSRRHRMDRSTVIEQALQTPLAGIRISFPGATSPEDSEAA